MICLEMTSSTDIHFHLENKFIDTGILIRTPT